MKKILFTVLVLAVSAITVMAQQGQGGGRPGTGQMREMMRDRLKTELKATDAQADSILAIQQGFQMKARDVRMDQALSADDKKTKMTALESDRKTKLQAVLSAEQVTKVEELYENMRKMREQRGQQRQGGN